MAAVSNEEVKKAVFELGGTKAPRPDGFTGNFYQKAWETVGPQVHAADIPGNYLGLPITWGRSKAQVLSFVIDRLKKKIQGWKQNFLSEAGREVLIKAVANSIPVYPMSCFLFPKNVIKKIDQIISGFWWKSTEEKKKMHWVSKESLKEGKIEGGLGFKEFEAFNLALLAKLGWRILQEPNQLWARILKAKYFPKSGFLEAKKGSRASWIWSSIIEGRKVLEGNIIASIGNGRNTRVWTDPWVAELPGWETFTGILGSKRLEHRSDTSTHGRKQGHG